MVKKRLSAQTITILILVILLLLTISFGGVYAYYSTRSTRISGNILMANLNINLTSESADGSERSEIVISNGTNVIPNQALSNTPLIVKNVSSVPIYLIVIYKVEAVDDKGEVVPDSFQTQIVDVGTSYYNPQKNIYRDVDDNDWVDYVYTYDFGDGTVDKYRCFVSTQKYETQNNEPQSITVIGKDRLKLSKELGNEYQSCSISFTFQAFAIGAESLDFETVEYTKAEQCKQIIDTIYESEEYKFLKISID